MSTTLAPQRFGRYVLLDRMGVGGMAEVFRAVIPGAEGFRRDLVVKRILSDRARAANFIEMFVHEARISALLHHPNVVQVFDFGQVDGSYFLAMELLRGSDLLAIFRSLRERQRQFPVAVAAHVAHQVALGLGYAHQLTSPEGQPLNIIHRDVSPSNIMCLRTGGVKLLDFGIAQAIGEMDSDESERSSFKGKMSYMAPERLRDEAQDGRVDLFALGAVLWEMLTARRLFPGKTEVEKLRSVLDKPIPSPSSLRPEVSPELDRIVLKALARDPDQRYATGQDMADDLEVVVGELKYQSRMLPALLVDLFGSAPSSAHLALSMASPELLAFDPIVTPPTMAALGPPPPRPPPMGFPPVTTVWPAVGLVSRIRNLGATTKQLAIGFGVLAIVGVAGLTARRSPEARSAGAAAVSVARGAAPGATVSKPPGPVAAATVSIPPAGVLGPPLSEGSNASSSPSNLFDVATPAAGIAKHRPAMHASAPASRRTAHSVRTTPAKSSNKAGTGRITRGLSIDPFAEAATRGNHR